MKKRDYLVFTSWIGVILLFLTTLFEVVQKTNYRLLFKLLRKFFIYSVIYLFIPLTIFEELIATFSINQIISQNILDLCILLWNYFVGIIAIKDLLKWKQENINNAFKVTRGRK